MASKSTSIIGPFDDANLASRILRMVPRTWQDQYKLRGATVPRSVRKLLKALERIENVFPTGKDHEGTKSCTKPSNSTKRKMISCDERIPKRCCKEKYCLLCKQHGGTHMSQTTLECMKYESNSTPKKNFNGNACGKSCGPKKHHQGESSNAQLSTKIRKLERSNKKMKHA